MWAYSNTEHTVGFLSYSKQQKITVSQLQTTTSEIKELKFKHCRAIIIRISSKFIQSHLHGINYPSMFKLSFMINFQLWVSEMNSPAKTWLNFSVRYSCYHNNTVANCAEEFWGRVAVCCTFVVEGTCWSMSRVGGQGDRTCRWGCKRTHHPLIRSSGRSRSASSC